MGSQSIAREAEGRMCYWVRGHEGEKKSKWLVKNNETKTILAS